VLVVDPKLPVNNAAELIAYAKANPGKLNYGSHGAGSFTHVSMEMFKGLTGTDMVHIPFAGGSKLAVGYLTGQVHVVIFDLVSIRAHEQAGKARIIAQVGDRRSPLYPNIPLLSETVNPALATDFWAAHEAVLDPVPVKRRVVDGVVPRRLARDAFHGARRRRLRRQVARHGDVRHADAQRRGARHFDAGGPERRRGQLHLASRSQHARLDAQRLDRYGAEEFDRQTSHLHRLRRLHPVQTLGQQRGRRAAVLGVSVPGAARVVGRYEPVPVGHVEGGRRLAHVTRAPGS
jgi:hypothetical protein